MRIEDFDIQTFGEINKNTRPNRDFVEDLKKFVLSVDGEIKKSQELKREFLNGKDIPLYQISIQAQKAKISLELLTKIRDEALKSYNAIINMRL